MVSLRQLAALSLLGSTGVFSLPVFTDELSLQFPGPPGTKPIPGDNPCAICDTYEPQLLTINSLTITPNPPEAGSNLTIEATGFLKEDITDGAYVAVEVRYGYVKLVNQEFDLCEQIENVDMSCPITKGPRTIKKVVELPKEIPPGKYTVKAQAFTDEDEYITCLTASVTFAIPPPKLSSITESVKGWVSNVKRAFVAYL
ncbi:ML domain-containing protein [Ascoidea rubescens DSM 1968]|uniref:Phosphatidylglycerol/phosphatidylinositol transfer protein n=1 Tax=Ascoidea rubescens DSM 1968 TaxID=1344418 RepID=A0A1D2VGA8_9ASCO|nr:Phosphatidylglycerol/phosphatidylinositol transfer protein [Ascoidea rubescens DSM 1968]ODV60622.1 Phosphatidylglycerol/phosphatidylinositol transfer protein [Ascoidea rubescens DSM 1968]